MYVQRLCLKRMYVCVCVGKSEVALLCFYVLLPARARKTHRCASCVRVSHVVPLLKEKFRQPMCNLLSTFRSATGKAMMKQMTHTGARWYRFTYISIYTYISLQICIHTFVLLHITVCARHPSPFRSAIRFIIL